MSYPSLRQSTLDRSFYGSKLSWCWSFYVSGHPDSLFPYKFLVGAHYCSWRVAKSRTYDDDESQKENSLYDIYGFIWFSSLTSHQYLLSLFPSVTFIPVQSGDEHKVYHPFYHTDYLRFTFGERPRYVPPPLPYPIYRSFSSSSWSRGFGSHPR